MKFLALENQSFDVYLPKIEIERQRLGRKIRIDRPLFYGYLFIKVRMSAATWIEIKKTPGVIRILSNHNKPVPIEDKEIKYIEEKVVKTYTIRNRQNKVPDWRKGEYVEILEGPFSGFTGEFNSFINRSRVVVFIDTYRQVIKIELHISQVKNCRSP